MAAAQITETLKETFGGIPTFIEDHVKHFMLNGESFICEPCGEPVQIVLDNKNATTINLKRHITSEGHKQKTPDIDQLLKKLKDLFSKVRPIKELPQIIYVNLLFLKLENQCYVCKLCNKAIRLNYFSLPKTEESFFRHLLSNDHEDRVKVFNDKCHEVTILLQKIYGTLPLFILDNVKFISKEGADYVCNLCQEQGGVYLTLEQFHVHLQSSDHSKNAEQAKAFLLLPKLRSIFESLPEYIIRNIEYIECLSDDDFFCSLCEEIITEQAYIGPRRKFELEQNMKFHFSCDIHVRNLFSKRDLQNKVYRRLHELFESFPNIVKKNIHWLGMKGNYFYCHLCKCKIKDEKDNHYTEKNILSHFVPLYKNVTIENSIHGEHLEQETERYQCVVKDLKKSVFGSIPEIIEKNIMYLRFCDGDRFVQCIICDKKIQFFGNNSASTEERFEQHLCKSLHCNTLNDREIEIHLVEKLFNPRYPNVPMIPVPQIISRNHMAISYVDTSDEREYMYILDRDCSSSDDEEYNRKCLEEIEKDRVAGENFYCNVCYDQKIILVAGKKSQFDDDYELANNYELANKLTEYNFRTHLLSRRHKLRVRDKASVALYTRKKLETLFGGIPKFVYNNVIHIKETKYGYSYQCTLCPDSIIMKSVRHFSENTHITKVNKIEQSYNLAMEVFNKRFWHVPEFIMKDVDFLQISGPNFFCVLCQETLYVDEYDLEHTEAEFRCHMSSRKHLCGLNKLRI